MEILETGIKVFDLITPFPKGGKVGRLRRRRRWARPSSFRNSSATSAPCIAACRVFAGVGERSREGNDLWHEMEDSGVLGSTRAGLRPDERDARRSAPASASPGLTMAEYFREERNQDVLLFIDNIYRYILAGMEVVRPAGPDALRRRLSAHP